MTQFHGGGKRREDINKAAQKWNDMRKSASRPSGGDGIKRLAIIYEYLMVPAIAIEKFAIGKRSALLAKIAGDQMRIKIARPVTHNSIRMNKMLIDELFDDTESMVNALWKLVDEGRKT